MRELSRDLDEQINSIRRELINLEELGILKSKTADNKETKGALTYLLKTALTKVTDLISFLADSGAAPTSILVRSSSNLVGLAGLRQLAAGAPPKGCNYGWTAETTGRQRASVALGQVCLSRRV